MHKQRVLIFNQETLYVSVVCPVADEPLNLREETKRFIVELIDYLNIASLSAAPQFNTLALYGLQRCFVNEKQY